MSYTQVYRFQNLPGYESVISKGNSDMTLWTGGVKP